MYLLTLFLSLSLSLSISLSSLYLSVHTYIPHIYFFFPSVPPATPPLWAFRTFVIKTAYLAFLPPPSASSISFLWVDLDAVLYKQVDAQSDSSIEREKKTKNPWMSILKEI